MFKFGLTLSTLCLLASACSAQPIESNDPNLLSASQTVALNIPASVDACSTEISIPIRVTAIETDDGMPVRFGVFTQTDLSQPIDEFAFFPAPRPGDQETFFVSRPECGPGATGSTETLTVKLIDQMGSPFRGNAEFEVEIGE
jgi:hypothetical protein